MSSIHDVVLREVNPFDTVTFYTRSFWQEKIETSPMVDSIHQEVITKIEGILQRVSGDRCTRTVLLCGDKGSGKSYLLGRIKKQLNFQAFFAYIGSWAESDRIWRHTLRYTVESLMHIPEGQSESQLLLWLKSLSAFQNTGLKKRVLGERNLFIHNLMGTYPVGITNAKQFFGVLYDLTNPDLYPIACQWLRGDDLDDEDLKALKVKRSIDSEDDAKNILANLGRISAETQPIVLCFDQLDNIPRLPNGDLDLQALFNVNTTIHTENLKNFLVIISLVTNTWKQNAKAIKPADLDRVERSVILLNPIDLDEAAALWASRLYPLHQQANETPPSPIYPLTLSALENQFPSGKTRPRYVLQLGQKLIQEYKTGKNAPPDPIAAFKLVWGKEFNNIQKKYSKISQLSSVELIQMLREVLTALEIEDIDAHILQNSKYASYSFSYQPLDRSNRIGIIWTEEPNLKSFFYVMKACEQALKQKLCNSMILIRAAKLGQSNNQGYKLFAKLFTGSLHHHITPHLDSIHFLATYHSLLNSACAGELVVGYETPNKQQLEDLIRVSQVLHKCTLLQELAIVPAEADSGHPQTETQVKNLFAEAKEFILNLVKTQQMLGRNTTIDNAGDRFDRLDRSELDRIIQELVAENKITLLGADSDPARQFVCLVPES